MAILYVKEIPGRRISVTRENVRTGVRKFRVRSNVPNESTFAIRTHRLVPKPWSLHPDEPFVFADVPQITQRKSKYTWDVEVDYSSEVDGEEEKKNPLDRKVKTDWSSQEFTPLVFIDADDKPILNTAGDPPEGGGLPIEDSFWVISVEKNVSHIPKKIYTENYASAVNEDVVRIDGITFEPGTLKAKRIRIGRIKRQEGVKFRQMTVEYHAKPESWKNTMLNRGFRQLIAINALDNDGNEIITTKMENILTSDDGSHGDPISEPAFLDLQGRYIDKPLRGKVRFVKGGTTEDPKPLPTEPDERKAVLDAEDRRAIIVLEWNVKKSRQFRGVLPLS